MRYFDTPCPQCGSIQSVWRAARSVSGIHIECRSCAHRFRLLHSASDILLVTAAFLAVYIPLAQISLLTLVTPPIRRSVSIAAALWPVLPALVAAFATMIGLHRRRYIQDDRAHVPERRLGSVGLVVWGVVAIGLLLIGVEAVFALIPRSVFRG